jgi:hypothetical protein
MLVVPLLAVVYEVRLEAEVGLRHSPINRRFNERKVGARTTTNFQDLGKKKYFFVMRLFGTPQDFHKSEEKFSKKTLVNFLSNVSKETDNLLVEELHFSFPPLQ